MMRSYNEVLNDDINSVTRFLLGSIKFGAALLFPVAISFATMFAMQTFPSAATYIAAVAYAIAGIKMAADVWTMYSLRLYKEEHQVNRQFNTCHVKTWFKWTSWSTLVAIATTIALATGVTLADMVNFIAGILA